MYLNHLHHSHHVLCKELRALKKRKRICALEMIIIIFSKIPFNNGKTLPISKKTTGAFSDNFLPKSAPSSTTSWFSHSEGMIGHLKESARKETKLPNDREIDTSTAVLSCPKSGLVEDSRWWKFLVWQLAWLVVHRICLSDFSQPWVTRNGGKISCVSGPLSGDW